MKSASFLVEDGVAEQLDLTLDRYYKDAAPEGWFCVYRRSDQSGRSNGSGKGGRDRW